jgi:hypothetical protein
MMGTEEAFILMCVATQVIFASYGIKRDVFSSEYNISLSVYAFAGATLIRNKTLL